MSNQSKNPTDVVTGKVRLSYVHLFKPYARPGSDPKFSTTLLIPKTDVATRQRIDAAINAAIQLGIAEKFKGVRPPILAIPIYDGDGVKPSDGLPFGEECKGHWVITAGSPATQQRPEIVDINMNPIINETEVYSGMYARVSIRFFPYDKNGKKGIGCGLGPVQKLEDGEPLGGRISAAAAFGDSAGFGQAAPAYPAQPAYGQPMPQPSYAPPAQQPAAYPYSPQYGTTVRPGAVPPAGGPGVDPITGLPALGGSVMGL